MTSFATFTCFDNDTCLQRFDFMALMISQLLSMISLEVGIRSADCFDMISRQAN